jgi:hypothetical protein
MKTLKGTLSKTGVLRKNLQKIKNYAVNGGDAYEIGILLSLILQDDDEYVPFWAKGYVDKYVINKLPDEQQTEELRQSEAQKLIEKLSAMLE